MSYDIELCVKVEDTDIYACVATPRLSSQTYNYGEIFRSCMDWDYSQSEKDENGEYKKCYYPCTDVLQYVNRGIQELRLYPKKYIPLLPVNGWGSLHGAIESLESLRDCIFDTAEHIPTQYLYMRW